MQVERLTPSAKSNQTWIDDLLKQNESSRKELQSIFGIDPNHKTDVKELDGMLKEYADGEENSVDMVRSVRGG